METTDLTTTILRAIREDIAQFEGRFDKLEGRFDRLEGRFDKLEGRFDALAAEVSHMGLNMQYLATRGERSGAILVLHDRMDRMQAQMVESNARAATAHQELQATLDQIMASLAGLGSLHGRIERCEQGIADIKERVF